MSSQLPVPPPSDRMAALLSTIAAQARRTNDDRVRELRTAVQQARSAGLDTAGWSVAEQTAHQLTGSAGTFGYAEVSDLGRTLERLLARAGRCGADAELLRQIEALLDQVVDQLAREPDDL